MTMKSVMSSLFCASMIAACGGEVAPEEEDGQTLEQEAAKSAQEENLGTSRQEMKWTPTKDPWYACLVGLKICRCSGDVVDCRNPIVIFEPASETTTTSR